MQIFLPDGNPRGIKIAEITSRTVQTVLIPRPSLEDASKRSEVDNVGLYFLIGTAEDGIKPILYIGEAENCLNRLKQHNKGKDFWSTAIVAVSKTLFFTKSHIKYLEWYCYEAAKEANRFILENSTIPTKPYISEPLEADLLDNFDTIKILVSTLGYPLFDSIAKKHIEKNDILFCAGKSVQAQGEYTEDGFVVFSGSSARLTETKGVNSWVSRLRKKLIEQGIIHQDGDTYKFTSEYIFSSPSAAAAVVLGRNANGWTSWKYQDGRTLNEVKRKYTEQQ